MTPEEMIRDAVQVLKDNHIEPIDGAYCVVFDRGSVDADVLDRVGYAAITPAQSETEIAVRSIYPRATVRFVS